MSFLNKLKIAKFKFVIEASQPLWLPNYKGSTFRGAFGSTFKKIVCVQTNRKCEMCLLQSNCAYYYVFETPNPNTLPELESPKAPHPFVLEPPLDNNERFDIGDKLNFQLILVGRGINYLPYFIYTFDELGRRGGIGKKRRFGMGKFKLNQVFDGFNEQNSIYDGQTKMMKNDFKIITANELLNVDENKADRIKIEIITPVRIKHNGKYLLKDRRDNLTIQTFIENLYRRIYYLVHFHEESTLEKFTLPEVNSLHIHESHLEWREWERYSFSQKSKIKLGGFVGKIIIKGNLTPWLPLIRTGEILHVGKATAFGLGKYILHVIS